MKIYGIAIVGANGSGKTTLGKELAKYLGYKHMDIENYSFNSSPIPYTNPRPQKEIKKFLLKDIHQYKRFILSSCNGDLGNKINAFYKYIIYIKVPLDIRMERVKNRAYKQFGNRILKGGDLYEQEQKFFKFVETWTMDKTDLWLKTQTCPIIYLDGTKSIEQNLKILKDKINTSFFIP